MQRGVLRGVGIDAWKFYEPKWYSTRRPGQPGATQPAIGNGTLVGRYTRISSGFVCAQIQLIAGSTTTFGTGEAYILGLPLPANRWTSALSLATADIPIGSGLAWQGSAANPSLTMALIPTLADPLAEYNLQTSEDEYLHLFIQQSVAYGTGTIPAGASPAVVTITTPVGQSASAYDINVVPTSTSTNNPQHIWVDTISYSNPNLSFNVNAKANPGGSGITFAWKVRAEPESTVGLAQLLNYQRPWTMASGHGLFVQALYEART